MAIKYAVASGPWSATATWSDTDGGAPGAALPADGDSIFISINVSVLMDADLSAMVGLGSVTIRGHATTPGLLYFKNGTNGYLKMRTAVTLGGSAGAVRGRLLANSDGNWATTTPLQQSNTAVLDLQGTTPINCSQLDLRLYCAQPTVPYLRTYLAKWTITAGSGTVSVANDTINLGSTPPAVNTAIRFTAAAGNTLPAPLQEDATYYVRAISGNLITVSNLSGNDDAVIDLTSVGSGTFTAYTGHTNTATGVMNVFEDVSADPFWSATAPRNTVVLVNDAIGADFQRVTLSAITSTTVTLSANVDSIQNPGARLFNAVRNVAIRSPLSSASQNLIACSGGGPQILNCEIGGNATSPGSNGAVINGSGGHIFGGVIWGAYYAVSQVGNYAALSTIGGYILGCITACNQSFNCEFTGVLAGMQSSTFINSNNLTISGLVMGGSTVLSTTFQSVISGEIRGCSTVSGSSDGLLFTPASVIRYLSTVFQTGTNITIQGSLYSCGTAFSGGVGYLVTGRIGFAPDGSRHRNTTDFSFPASTSTAILNVVCRGAQIERRPYYPFFSQRGVGAVTHPVGTFNQNVRTGLFIENANKTLGNLNTFLPTADVYRRFANNDWLIGTKDPTIGTNITAVNLRSVIAVGRVPVLGTKVRVWFGAYSTGPTTIVGASIGKMTASNVFDATPTRITFNGGSSGVVIPTSKMLLSDEITFTFDPAFRYGLHVTTDGVVATLVSSNMDGYYITNAGDQTMALAPTINTTSATNWGPIVTIEIYGNQSRILDASYVAAFPLSNCDVGHPAQLLDLTELEVPASAQTRTIYMRGYSWTTFPTAAQLYLEAEYLSDGTLQTAVAASTAVLVDNVNWVPFVVSFTPAVKGHVRYRAWLKLYQPGARVLLEGQMS